MSTGLHLVDGLSPRPGRKHQHPTFHLLRRLLNTDPPLPDSVFRVGVAVAVNLNKNGQMWHGLASLMVLSARSRATVWRALKVLTEGDSEKGWLPLLLKKPPVRTVGPGRRKSCTYTLVQHPAGFVAARDRAREAKAIQKIVGWNPGNGQPKKKMNQNQRRQLIRLQFERESGRITPSGTERLMELEKLQERVSQL